MKPVKTRRAFIKTGAAALCGLAAAPALAAKPRKSAEWAETFDVIVIGSGLAAFVAGLSALENGAKRVVLLEKMGMIGGSTAISNGTISVPGSPLQKAKGIEDSPEAMLGDLLKAGKGFCHPDLTRTLVEANSGCAVGPTACSSTATAASKASPRVRTTISIRASSPTTSRTRPASRCATGPNAG